MEKIVYSDANTMGVNSPLFAFDSIMDTDFGLMSYIYREYLDTNVFSVDFFEENKSVEKMVYALATRKQENPLLLAMKDKENYDLADDLYSEFYNYKYKEMITNSMTTGIYDLLQMMEYQGGISVGILIARQEEKDFLEALNVYSHPNYINIYNENDLVNVGLYNQIFFKSCNDRFINHAPFTDLIYEKNIYMARYPFNIDEEEKIIFSTPTVLKLEMNRCRFFQYDIYDFSEDNEEENPNDGLV